MHQPRVAGSIRERKCTNLASRARFVNGIAPNSRPPDVFGVKIRRIPWRRTFLDRKCHDFDPQRRFRNENSRILPSGGSSGMKATSDGKNTLETSPTILQWNRNPIFSELTDRVRRGI